MNGFYNMVLRVNVSDKSFELQPISDEVLQQTLGGKGLATHLLLKHNPPGVDPLSADNHLIFATGPASGSGIWGSCRHGVFTKSPQTGFYSESYSGGKVAEQMVSCGFDAIMIYGRADKPVWIEIGEDVVRFHSADDLWGRETYETEDRVKAWVKESGRGSGKCGVICIGPAGENLVSFAVIENDYWRSAGRTGVGAVMGAKKIKAISFQGRRKKAFADEELLKDFIKDTASESKENPGVIAYKTKGTPMLVDMMNNAGGFPTRYWKKGRYEKAGEINADALHQKCDVKPNACLKCFMACGRLSTVKNGRHKGLRLEGPEYETIYAFGGLCEIDSIEEIIYLNDICDRLGLDTISAGNLAALTIEASKQGKIEYAVDYGDVDAIADLLKAMAECRGIGAILSKGIKFTAHSWGMENQAIHVKGLEPAGYDPRVLKGMGLAYGTSDRGACHLRATFYKPELAGIVDPEKIEGKAHVFAEWEDRLTIFDTLVFCRFYRDLYQWDQLSTILKCTVGLDLDREAMRIIASTVSDNTRIFNLREGLTKKDDMLPKRFHEEALPENDMVITEDQMEQMLKEYYHVRGWNDEGVPKTS